VFYDGVTLAKPTEPGANRVRNGSGERTWPYVRQAVDARFKQYTRRSPTNFVTSLLDWRRALWIYPRAAASLFQSFWARFGWNQISVAKEWYWLVGAMTLTGIVGTVIAYMRHRRSRQPAGTRRAIDLLALSILLAWINASLRVHPYLGKPFIPAARYAYPAIIPTVLVLVNGWGSILPRRFWRWGAWAGLGALVLLDAVSIQALYAFYYGG
jgi:hypothetical protein